MPLLPVALPQSVPIRSGFDYVTVDAQRRRVYAAHTASSALLVVDADTGKVLRQVRVGPLHGVVVDPANGHVYTGNGDGRSVSDVDPEAGQVVREVDVPGEVDAVAYDPTLHRIYADEDNGARIFVIDAATMRNVGTVTLPGHKPEYLAVDPVSHDVYQNIADLAEYVVIDSKTLAVKQTVKTPDLTNNHPLQYDPALGRVVVGGGGALAVYDRQGQRKAGGPGAPRIDQCDLDPKTHFLACAGGGFLTLYSVGPDAAPSLLARVSVPKGVHTVAIDTRTDALWVVWATESGDFVQAYRFQS